MMTACYREIRAFLTVLDLETPQTINTIIARLRDHYPYFWFEEERVRRTLAHCKATSFTAKSGREYFYLEGEALERMTGWDASRALARAEQHRPKAA